MKLGLKDDTAVAYVDAPAGFADLLGRAPNRVSLRGRLDLVVCFVTRRADLERRTPVLKRAIAPDGMAWIAWPKKASGVRTDVTEGVIRDVVLPMGLVDVKVCAIDETWSGLKLVIRKELR